MKAVIVAGGKGTRLGPYAAVFPKPLMPLGDEMPVLELLLHQLRGAGVKEVILAVNHLQHLIRAFFGQGERIGMRISYSLEDAPLGTAGPLGLVLQDVGETFFMMNGDLLTTLDFRHMLADHRACGAAATIASFKRELKIDFGLLETDAALRMTGYVEKPSYTHLVSMGCYVLERDAVTPYLHAGRHLDMPELMRAMIADGQHVHCHIPNCIWLDIGRPDDYAAAQDLFATSRETFFRAPS